MVYIKANYGKGEVNWGYMTKRKHLRFGPLASRSQFEDELGILLADMFDKAWKQSGGRGLISAVPVPGLTFEEWCAKIEENERIKSAYFGRYIESGGIDEMKKLYLQCVSVDDVIQGELDAWD